MYHIDCVHFQHYISHGWYTKNLWVSVKSGRNTQILMRNSRNIVISDSQEPLKISLLSVLGVSTIQEAQVWVYSENWICNCTQYTYRLKQITLCLLPQSIKTIYYLANTNTITFVISTDSNTVYMTDKHKSRGEKYKNNITNTIQYYNWLVNTTRN